MRIKRFWNLGIALVAGLFIFAACGGGSTALPVTSSGSTPVATSSPGSTGSSAGQSTAGEAGEQPSSTATGYTWQIFTVDTNGSKPSLAVDADGVPHIAYMLEDMPGFVRP